MYSKFTLNLNMPSSIREIRKQLGIRQDDLASLLGVTRGWVHQFESGIAPESKKTREELYLLQELIARAEEQQPGTNPWLDHATLSEAAEQWKSDERERAAVRAEEYHLRLQEMKDTYTQSMDALNLLAAMRNDPECPEHTRQWIEVIAPKVVRTARKNNPAEQARLEMRYQEALGKAH